MNSPSKIEGHQGSQLFRIRLRLWKTGTTVALFDLPGKFGSPFRGPLKANSTHSLLSDKFTRRGKCHSPFLLPALFTPPPPATSWPGAGYLAGCPSRTHALDPCWATLSAGGARLSSPWLTPAQRPLHLRVVNRSTHSQLRRQTPPRQREVKKDAGTPSWTRAEAVAPEAKA